MRRLIIWCALLTACVGAVAVAAAPFGLVLLILCVE
jgi:hypothetical protein